MVERIGFKDFGKSLHRYDELPSRKTVSFDALDDVYSCLKTQLTKILMAAPERGHITFDTWTDSFKKNSYCTFTYHYLKNWEMCSTVLKTACFNHPHTSKALKEFFESMIKEYGLANKKISISTDGAKNMIRCGTMLNLYRFGCIAHSLNRLIQHDLLDSKDPEIKPINYVISKIRKTQRSLIYRFNELKRLHDKDKNDLLLLMLDEFNDLERTWDCEMQFCDLLNETENENFDKLTSISRIRWTCLQKTMKCHLAHQRKAILEFQIDLLYSIVKCILFDTGIIRKSL